MTGAVMGGGDKQGLVTGHAFTVLGVNTYFDKAANKDVKLVKIRNPWGSERYKGAWSDKDTKSWTDEARRALNHQANMADGVFFMPISNYQKLFYNTIVGFYSDWKIARKDNTWDRKSSIKKFKWTISNPVAQHVNIGIAGPMRRQFSPRWGCKSSFQMESFYYVMVDGQGKRMTDSNKRWYKWSSSNDAFVYNSLPAGTYSL